MTPWAAFERLRRIARSDIGQSRRAANFILAWWNTGSLGGCDLADIFGVDREIAHDIASVGSPGRISCRGISRSLPSRNRGLHHALVTGGRGTFGRGYLTATAHPWS
ncbi:DUF7673 family protein [Roseixanthobacter glucoisosaccharinicivorans]|uniref:DUF7673 family protein n=1 Tax=Roseixanthobacter glucoisosaccharinicivorans TaxID=3119923 RepID=UPI004040B419